MKIIILLMLLCFCCFGCNQKSSQSEQVFGKPDSLINLCGKEKRWNVSKLVAKYFKTDWVLCEVDCDYTDGQMGVPWKTIAIKNYPNMGSLTTESVLDLQIKAVNIGRYQDGDMYYEAYDCAAATNSFSAQ